MSERGKTKLARWMIFDGGFERARVLKRFNYPQITLLQITIGDEIESDEWSVNVDGVKVGVGSGSLYSWSMPPKTGKRERLFEPFALLTLPDSGEASARLVIVYSTGERVALDIMAEATLPPPPSYR